MKALWLAIGVFLAYMALIPFSYIQGNQAGYNKGFDEGIKYDRKMRKQAHDSIVANCTWNNGIPVTVVTTNNSLLKEHFPKPNMNKLLKGE